MRRRLLWRALQLVPTLLAVSLLAFALGAALGDPVGALLGPDAAPALHAETARALGIDRSLAHRYSNFLVAALRGDLGTSWRAGRPVADLLRERLPASVELTSCATVVAAGLGVPGGLVLALRPRSLWARGINALALLAASVPPFLLGLLLIEAFAVEARLLPAFGRGEVVSVAGWATGFATASGRRALVLPALTLGLFQAALVLRVTHAEIAAALASRPIRFARARGLPARAVVAQALRLVRVPLLTVLAPQVGGLLAFAIVTESVFSWPGLGALLVHAIDTGDVPVVAACLLIAGVVFCLLSLLADAAAVALDPRLRASAE